MLSGPEQVRFWSKVQVTDDCWLWTAGIFYTGYGIFTRSTPGTRRAHRIAYEELVGPIPDGLVLDHLCRVKRCVNPDHLDLCTLAENSRRNRGHLTRTWLTQGCVGGQI